MPSLIIRFQKFDKYENPVFIASNKTEEKESYNKLKKIHTQLSDKEYDTFLPIYYSEQFNYTTIRFKKHELNSVISDKYKELEKNDVYNIDFVIKKKVKDTKIYINCFVNSIKLVSKAPKVDYGEDLELEL